MDFRVQLDSYYGPLDLLLYLVRKEELEVVELSVAQVTSQFLDAVAVLEQLDINAISDYLEVAARLIELKSRVVLPQHEEIAQEIEDPHEDLVQRLIEYKQFRDAASLLEACDARQRRRFARHAEDLAAPRRDPADAPLQAVELWDLVSAFTRVMRDNLAPPEDEIVRYDETPVHVYMQRFYERLRSAAQVSLASLFPEQVHKSELIGALLAILELVRHGHALVEQVSEYGDLLLSKGARPFVALPEGLESAADSRATAAAAGHRTGSLPSG